MSLKVLNDFSPIYITCGTSLMLDYAKIYVRSSAHLKLSPLSQVKALKKATARMLWALMFPKGFALYMYDKWRKKVAAYYKS